MFLSITLSNCSSENTRNALSVRQELNFCVILINVSIPFIILHPPCGYTACTVLNKNTMQQVGITYYICLYRCWLNQKHMLGNLSAPLLVFNYSKIMYRRRVSFTFILFIGNNFRSMNRMFSALARCDHVTACKSSWQVRGRNYSNQMETENSSWTNTLQLYPETSYTYVRPLRYAHLLAAVTSLRTADNFLL
jgi:hypothetical protein